MDKIPRDAGFLCYTLKVINFAIVIKTSKKFRPTIVIGLLTLLIFAGSFLVYWRFTVAGSANLYPGSCLGSWQNPDKAQGRPDVLTINKENSAVFSEGGIKEIYCGSFNGDLSENEIKLIKNVTLKFSWLVSDEESQAATSSITIIQPPATSSEEIASNTDYIINQILDNVSADEVKVIISTTTPEITIITNIANSEVTSIVPQISPSIDSDQTTSTSSKQATSSPTSFWWKKYSFFSADDQVPNTAAITSISETIPVATSSVSEITGQTATSSLDSSLAPTEDFLKVSYTLDGVDWQVLGMVNKNNWQDISFQIPVYQLEDVKKIQIKIESLPLVNKTPYVYLDGTALQVEYDTENLSAAVSSFFSVERLDSKKLFVSWLYSRSPSGNAISSPVAIQVNLENFVTDTGGCNESDYWGVAFRYKSKSDSNSLTAGDLSNGEKFVFTPLLQSSVNMFNGTIDLPAGEITQVAFSCWDENLDLNIQSYDRQWNSIAGDLEIIDFEEPVFKIVP